MSGDAGHTKDSEPTTGAGQTTGSGQTTRPGPTTALGPPLEPRIREMTGETLVELLARAVARTPDATALVIRRGLVDERWTYAELLERSGRVAATLRRRGVGPGERVVTWSLNDPWLVAAYFAIWRLGAMVVPLDLRMQRDVAARIGARTRPVLLLAGPEVEAASAAALGVPILALGDLAAGLDAGVEPDIDAPVGPATPAEVLFTSGTTSDPKGVVLTHGQVIHTARAIAQTGMGKAPDRALSVIPLSHMYGQSVPLLLGFISGSTLVYAHALTPSAIGATLRRERITALTLVPQLVGILLQGIEAEAGRQGRLESLRRARRLARWLPWRARRVLFRAALGALGGHLSVITCGGAPLTPEMQLAWELMGVAVVQGYGTTECAAICGHSRSSRRPGTVGPPLAGIEVRIEPDGELLVRGPNVMTGYWEAAEATAEVLDAAGWFHTGDAAAIDGHGEVLILGRTRDRIALPNGMKVYPEDVEVALRETGDVRTAVVFEASPGRLAAVLVPMEPSADEPSLEAAVRRANAGLAPHQRVGSWRRWPDDDFPRTHTLKVRREPVKAWYAESVESGESGSARARPKGARSGAVGSVGPGQVGSGGRRSGGAKSDAARSGPAATSEDLRRDLCALLAGVLAELHGGEPPSVTTATTIESLGLDSLARVTLALRIEEAFDAPLSDDQIATAADVADLAGRVAAVRGQPPPPQPSRWAFSRPARILRRLLDATLTGAIIELVARPRAEGLEHLEGLTGPILICPSHASHLDAPSVRHVLPSHMREWTAIAAAADVFFHGSPLGPVVALLDGGFPFGRVADVRASLERVAELVGDGWNVMIFPEGTRSPDGVLGPMREGVGLLATGLGVPIVPVAISGAHRILPKGQRLPRRGRGPGVRVRFGEPLRLAPGTSIQEATKAVGRSIAALVGADAARPDTLPPS